MIPGLSRIVFTWAKSAELLFFPSFCGVCSRLLEKRGERVVCASCLDTLRPASSSFCPCCGRFYEADGDSHECQKCLWESPPFTIHRSCARYSGTLKDIILLYKYRHFEILGKVLAEFAHTSLGKDDGLWQGVEAVIPVPLHPKKQKQRGFNQSEIIAKEIARLKKKEYVGGRLVKVRNVLPQTSLEAGERERNVKGAFDVVNSERLKGKVVLLVDDVYTTGSTIRECSAVLKKAGAREVRAFTIAQA